MRNPFPQTPEDPVFLEFLFVIGALGTIVQLYRTNLRLVRRNRELAAKVDRDGMTGLMAKEAFMANLDRRLASTAVFENHRHGKTRTFALFLIDGNGFGAINKRYGHDVGDKVIVALADALCSAFRPEDMCAIARFGGDEFMVLAENVPFAVLHSIVERVDRHVSAVNIKACPIGSTREERVAISVATGVAWHGNPTPISAEGLFRDAVIAQNDAKRFVPKSAVA